MRKIVLPFNGYPTGQALLKDMRRTLSNSAISDLLAFVKINDGVHFMDVGGPKIFQSIHFELANRNLPIGIFLDLKIFDVSATLENVLKKYTDVFSPDILTVSAACSVEGIIKLRQLLPNTKLVIVSVPSDMSESECSSRFGKSPAEKIMDDLLGIKSCYSRELLRKKISGLNPEPFDMISCSSYEVPTLKKYFRRYGFIITDIRDKWMEGKSEYQKRIAGIKKSLENGDTYVVAEPQVIKGNQKKKISSKKKSLLTINEIESFLIEKKIA